MTAAASTAVANYLARPTAHRQWEGDYRSPENEAFYERAFDAIARRLAAPPDSLILDAGCGIGAHSLRLARRGFHVEAVDFSESVIEPARANIAANGLEDRVTVRQGSLLDLPFPDGHFPYALSWGVLMHVPDVERAVAELARVVRPGGTLVISESNVRSLQSVGFRLAKRLLRREKAEVVRTAAGLEFWVEREGGKLVTRETDLRWLAVEFGRHGLTLTHRRAGQLTEAYTRVPTRPLRRLVHLVNHAWFRCVRLPGPAFGNLLFFEKAIRELGRATSYAPRHTTSVSNRRKCAGRRE